MEDQDFRDEKTVFDFGNGDISAFNLDQLSGSKLKTIGLMGYDPRGKYYWIKKPLGNIKIGQSVTSIGANIFNGCDGLTSVTIPDSVTSIEGYAFNNCSGLTSVTIPDSVTNIGKVAFCNCSGLTSVTIGNSVTSIGENAFENCESLT